MIMTQESIAAAVAEFLASGGVISRAKRAKKAKGLRYFNVTRRSKKIGKTNFHGARV
jgi:hypothetical protein